MSQRENTQYKGLSLVAAFWKGKYQGRAWASSLGTSVAHVYGDSIEDVMQKLRGDIDAGNTECTIKDLMVAKHGEFLKIKGISLEEIDLIRLNRVYEELKRQPHCYECSEKLDNEYDLECSRCGWIICHCGACGCGHPVYGPKIAVKKTKPNYGTKEKSVNRFPSSRDTDNSVSKSFSDFASASQYAQQRAGSILRREPDGWLVTRISPCN